MSTLNTIETPQIRERVVGRPGGGRARKDSDEEITVDEIDVDKMKARQMEMISQFTAYQTTAIPKKVTDHNYQQAV